MCDNPTMELLPGEIDGVRDQEAKLTLTRDRSGFGLP